MAFFDVRAINANDIESYTFRDINGNGQMNAMKFCVSCEIN